MNKKEDRLQFLLTAVCDAAIQEHKVDFKKGILQLKLTNNFDDEIEDFDILLEEIFSVYYVSHKSFKAFHLNNANGSNEDNNINDIEGILEASTICYLSKGSEERDKIRILSNTEWSNPYNDTEINFVIELPFSAILVEARSITVNGETFTDLI